MLNETASPKKDLADSFYLKSSQWINVTGFERGNRDHYVDAQGDRVFEIVKDAFDKAVATAEKKLANRASPRNCYSKSLYYFSV